MPGRRFEYHPEAVAEAAEAFQWYAAQSQDAAERFWHELRRARELVTTRPEVWGPYYHGTRCFRLHRFPYGLVYITRDERIIGLAVAHLKRRPGYWRHRLD
jgi:plasmid stabilization system protein ParE